jgi:hypothetical protein
MNYLLPAIAAGTVAGAAYFLGDIPTKDSMGSTASTGPTTSTNPIPPPTSTGPAGPAGSTGIGNITEISTITPNLKEKITETAAITDTPQSPEPKKQESEESEEPSEPKEPSEEPEEISPETAAMKGGAIGVPNWGRDAKLLIKDTVVSQGDLFAQLNKLNGEISELEQKEKEASFYSSNSNVELKTLYEKIKNELFLQSSIFLNFGRLVQPDSPFNLSSSVISSIKCNTTLTALNTTAELACCNRGVTRSIMPKTSSMLAGM